MGTPNPPPPVGQPPQPPPSPPRPFAGFAHTVSDAVACDDLYVLRFARWRGIAIRDASTDELRAIIAALIRDHPGVRQELLGR